MIFWNSFIFCVTCVAWQTHRDHVVRLRLRRRHTFCFRSHFCFRSVTWKGQCFHSNFAERYTTIKYTSSSPLVIIRHILTVLYPFFRLSFCCSFPLNKFWRDAMISLKLCRTLYHSKIQVRFKIGNHLPNFGWVTGLFRLSFCWCVDIGFRSVSFAGMHWFYWKFAEGHIIVNKIQVKFDISNHSQKILARLRPFFDLVFICVLILFSSQ